MVKAFQKGEKFTQWINLLESALAQIQHMVNLIPVFIKIFSSMYIIAQTCDPMTMTSPVIKLEQLYKHQMKRLI